jgi:transcriptional regulator with GAF, ATPase, and Fis domain
MGGRPIGTGEGGPMSELELAQMFAEMATSLEAQPSTEQALEQTVRLAVEAVHGCEMAGVSWCVRGKKMETPFATEQLVSEADSLQYRLDEGPVFGATEDGDVTVIADTRFDKQYPRFSAAVAELGIASVLSCQLSSPRRVLGALNLYARKPDAFDEVAREIAQIYAAHASIVVANRSLQADLRTAVDTRGTIGQAMGILIERHKVEAGRAFDMLVEASQSKHVKLRDIASLVVETGQNPANV